LAILEVVWHTEAELCFGGYSEPDRGFGKIETALSCVACLRKSVFKLQAAAGDDNAGTGDLRAIGRDGVLRVGAAGRRLGRVGDGSRGEWKEQ